MPTAPRPSKLYLALYANAALLGLILLTLWSRGGVPAPAYGQMVPQAATSANGVTIMPGQLSPQTYGCYLLDADKQTLCVYQFSPGEHDLRLAAARDVQYDRQLRNFNTTPPPTDVLRLSQRAAQTPAAVPPAP